MMIEIIQKW